MKRQLKDADLEVAIAQINIYEGGIGSDVLEVLKDQRQINMELFVRYKELERKVAALDEARPIR